MPKRKNKKPTFNVVEQWIEVTSENGKTRTTLYPPNAILFEEAKEMEPPPLLVYRRFNFLTGVPAEYGWTGPDANTRLYGGACVQRMTFETWLEAIAIEALSPDGHLRPTGKRPVPRPVERGGCSCPTCFDNHDVLAEIGLAS